MGQFWILVWAMILVQMTIGVAFTQWYYGNEDDSQAEPPGVTPGGG